jgi:2-C-methyl-D-erythritol 4-phosphate cytidylyltransferase
MSQKFTAILLMAGSGTRFGSLLPKQLHEIDGKKVYQHALETFLQSGLFHEIILVCHPDWQVSEPGTKTVIGGKTRQESSFLGLQACDPSTDYVVIHDGTRPFISLDILKEHVKRVQTAEAVNTCIRSPDTIVHSATGHLIDDIPLRSEYWLGQTPQSFAYDLILEAHRRTKKKNSTDDCSLVLDMGCDVYIVQGSEENLKITTERDLALLSSISCLMKRPC